MKLKLLIIFSGFILGVFLGVIIFNSLTIKNFGISFLNPLSPVSPKKIVIGFLPYWLLNKAEKDYSAYINTLAYFGVKMDGDGSIQKLLNPREKEPGWYALESGKADPFLKEALKNNVSLSLVVTNFNNNEISKLISDPVPHAKNLIADLKPIMEKYKFSDVNLDIESTKTASQSARANFAKFVETVKKGLENNVTLTVEISGDDLIKNKLIDPRAIGKFADNVVLMAYDYHYSGSFVTGPVAPLGGSGIISEYDVSAATEKLLDLIHPQKIILGIPLYGYEWESIGKAPRSAVIPNSGVAASNSRAEKILDSCSSCSSRIDKEAEENYISYLDENTGSYHTIFYPNKNSTIKKVNFATNSQLGGVAYWALGYEGDDILYPLVNYQKDFVKPFIKRGSFSLEKAPMESLSGKIATMSGSVKWQSRTSPSPVPINSLRKLMQGEELETKKNGKATVEFDKVGMIKITPDTQLNFVQTLPANFVVEQKKGTAEYIKRGDIPVSITSLDLLINLNSGRSIISVDEGNSQIIISVESGSATVAFNDRDNLTNILTVDEGREYIFNNDSRIGGINNL